MEGRTGWRPTSSHALGGTERERRVSTLGCASSTGLHLSTEACPRFTTSLSSTGAWTPVASHPTLSDKELSVTGREGYRWPVSVLLSSCCSTTLSCASLCVSSSFWCCTSLCISSSFSCNTSLSSSPALRSLSATCLHSLCNTHPQPISDLLTQPLQHTPAANQWPAYKQHPPTTNKTLV